MINCKEKVFRIYRENLISLDRKINNMMTYLVKSKLIQVIFIIYFKIDDLIRELELLRRKSADFDKLNKQLSG